MNFEEIARLSRERAKARAEQEWPPDMIHERKRAEEKYYLEEYRALTGAPATLNFIDAKVE